MKTYGKVEIYRDDKKEWRWRLITSNGRIVADSAEGYLQKRAVINGLEASKKAFKSYKLKYVLT